MDWLMELVKASPVMASVVVVIWTFTWFVRNQKADTEKVLQRYLEIFNEQQQQIEREFREYLIKDSKENRKVLEEYTGVIKAFNETVSKTNVILEQNLRINERLLSHHIYKNDKF